MPLAVGSLLLVVLLLTDLTTPAAFTPRPGGPAHHLRRGFQNVNPDYAYSLAIRARRLLEQILVERPGRGRAFEVLPNDGAELRSNGFRETVTWIGHSTFLLQIDGVNILTDPHWGERASPVSFAGPRRLVPPGLAFEALPRIDAVVISHDHYDHLDEDTVRRLDEMHRPTFFVPLGLEAWLRSAGIRAPVVELDWWQAAELRGLRFVCTPAQHSSGRGLHDQNRRLWGSWVIAGPDERVFFAGDTGYYEGFREIGRRFGPFDLALVPVGGYYAWGEQHPNHVNPEEAVQLFEDVGGRLMVPMHWGTFDMNREPFREPPDRLLAEALRRGLEERIGLLSPGQTIHW